MKRDTCNPSESDWGPAAIFVGDFNVGKSSVLNALLRKNLLFTSREESRTPPAFLARGVASETVYAAYDPAEQDFITQSHAQFLSIRQYGKVECPFTALSAVSPDIPFSNLILVDTPGASTEIREHAFLPGNPGTEQTLFILTTTIEYWPARHTLALIAEYHRRFPGRFMVVANMADQLNHDEIRRILDKAAHRIESHGTVPAPPFYVVSAKLEYARRHPDDEYRRRVKRDVRDLCDAGFDALRVALYEFEAQFQPPVSDRRFDTLFNGPLASLVASTGKGNEAC